MKWHFLHFSAFTAFLHIKSTRLVCYLLHFSHKITMKWHFLHFSAFTAFLHIKSTRLVCYLLHFSHKITMKWHFLHFSAFTAFLHSSLHWFPLRYHSETVRNRRHHSLSSVAPVNSSIAASTETVQDSFSCHSWLSTRARRIKIWPIIPEYSQILFIAYYSQNYSGIISACLSQSNLDKMLPSLPCETFSIGNILYSSFFSGNHCIYPAVLQCIPI